MHHRTTLLCGILACVAGSASGPAMAQGVREHVVVTNYQGDSVSAYTKAPATGTLSAVAGSPFVSGNGPRPIVVDPRSRFCYTADVDDLGTISAFSIDPETGVLAPVTGSPFAEGGDPENLVIDPTGRFLYVSDPLWEKIKGFHVDRATGVLTPFQGTGFPVANNVFAAAIDSAGRHLFASTLSEGLTDYNSRIYVFSIEDTTGTLALQAGPYFVGNMKGTYNLTVHPSDRFLYAVNTQADEVVGYAIDPTAGTLTALPGSPFPAGDLPQHVAADPPGRFLYVSNTQSSSISAYAVNPSTGVLTPVAGSPFSAGLNPTGLVVDSSGLLLYVASFSSQDVRAYTIHPSTGALTPLGSPVAAGAGAFGMARTSFGDTIFEDGFDGGGTREAQTVGD